MPTKTNAIDRTLRDFDALAQSPMLNKQDANHYQLAAEVVRLALNGQHQQAADRLAESGDLAAVGRVVFALMRVDEDWAASETVRFLCAKAEPKPKRTREPVVTSVWRSR